MTTVERLMSILVRNPGVAIGPEEVCLFQAPGQRITSIHTTTSQTTKPSKIGFGVVVPVSKHFGLGIGRRKVKTEKHVTRSFDKSPCVFYMLGTRFLIQEGSFVSEIDSDDIKHVEVHSDAIEINAKGGTVVVLMDKNNILRYKNVWKIIGQANREGIKFEDFARYATKILNQTNGYVKPEQNQSTRTINQPYGYIKPEQGQFAKTVFLAVICKKPSAVKKRTEYPKYVFDKLGIQNAESYHRQLISDGYLEPLPLSERLKSLKLNDLKSLLESYKLPTTGKKDDLVNLAIQSLGHQEIEKLYPSSDYVLSKKGFDFIEEHKDYVEIHRHSNWQIDWMKYDQAKADKPGLKLFDYCWGVFNERILQNIKNTELCRNEYYNMYEILREENKIRPAFDMLTHVLFIDVNYSYFVAPAIASQFVGLEEGYNTEIIDTLYMTYQNQHKCCRKEMFQSILKDIMDGTYSDAKYQDWYKNIIPKFNF